MTHNIIIAFADEMAKELHANRDKGSWINWTDREEIYKELFYHQEKLKNAERRNDRDAIKEHIADCANFLMMLGNSYGLYPHLKPSPIMEIEEIKRRGVSVTNLDLEMLRCTPVCPDCNNTGWVYSHDLENRKKCNCVNLQK